MRIAYIAAGAGGMYCGSCLHDNTLATELLDLGHEVALLPTYTPLKTDEADVSDRHVFYGALNVYLQQKVGLFRRTPRFVDRWLDGRPLLRWISRLGATTDPHGLGDLTLEMLRGEAGAQRKELERLVGWLDEHYRPDVVVITNSLLLGLARRLREQLEVPVVVGVQGEDLFIDGLPEPVRGAVLSEMRQRARDADLLLAPSRYYADHMAQRLDLDRERFRVVPLGISVEGYRPADRSGADGVTIGYLARISPEKGLHRLVRAFERLAADDPRLRLRIGGYLGPRERPYLEEQLERLRQAGLDARVTVDGEVDRDGKLQLLREIDLLCVPTTYPEPKGLFALEAMASGVPVVLPRHGSLPEIVEETGGGVLCDPESLADLETALRRLVDDPAERRRLGDAGRAAVLADRTAAVMARRTERVLSDLVRDAEPVERSA